MEGNGLWSIFIRGGLNISSNQPSSQTLFSFYQTIFSSDYTQYIPICQVLKHIKNPQKYPKTIDKLIKNVYNVWIIWGK